MKNSEVNVSMGDTGDIAGVKVGDRVKRAGLQGPRGTVRSIRVETVRTTLKKETGEPPGICVTVLWDNGTLSHFIPEGLVKDEAN